MAATFAGSPSTKINGICRVLFDPRSHAPTLRPWDGRRDKSITIATVALSRISRTEGACVPAWYSTRYPASRNVAIKGSASRARQWKSLTVRMKTSVTVLKYASDIEKHAFGWRQML
jgi:hypothetical protein